VANFSALVDVLSIAGSRLSDGTPNSSGTVWIFQPGGNTPANAYSGAAATTLITQPITLTAGGTLNLADFPNGLYVTSPVRLLVQDVSGNTVVDTVYIPATAGDVGVDNAGFTDSNLDDVLTKALTSFGGQDWQYKESGGATERTVKAKFSEIHISVKDFGAVGDGVAIDTTAVQAAINRVKALGGGVCYFPPGTYKVDQVLSLSSATGVRLVGAGSRAAIIATTHASANTFIYSSCTACTVENLRIDPAGANSGYAVAVISSVDTGLHRVTVKSNHSAAIAVSGATSNVLVTECSLVGVDVDVLFTASGEPSTFFASRFAGGVKAMTLSGTAQNVNVTNCFFSTGTTGIEFQAGLTGTNFEFVGSPTLKNCTTPLLVSTATLPVYRQWGNGIDASATSSATTASQTPFLYKGNEVILTAASGGAGVVTVNAPAVLPGTATTDVNLYWDFVFINGAGGAVTWTMNAVFVVSAAIPTTDAHTIAVRFRWDKTTSKLREVSRADTVT